MGSDALEKGDYATAFKWFHKAAEPGYALRLGTYGETNGLVQCHQSVFSANPLYSSKIYLGRPSLDHPHCRTTPENDSPAMWLITIK
jgi:TPR repeat protein